MNVRSLWVVSLLVLVSGGLFAGAADGEKQLSALVEQAFDVGHELVVVLPDQTVERLSRSERDLPAGWPAEKPLGLIKKEYFEQAFRQAGRDRLARGVLITFQNEAEGFYVVVAARLTAPSTMALSGAWAGPGLQRTGLERPGTGGDPCDGQTDWCMGGGKRFGTMGHWSHIICQGRSCVPTGLADDWGNPIYRCSDGSTRIGCKGTLFGGEIVVATDR